MPPTAPSIARRRVTWDQLHTSMGVRERVTWDQLQARRVTRREGSRVREMGDGPIGWFIRLPTSHALQPSHPCSGLVGCSYTAQGTYLRGESGEVRGKGGG